MRVQVELGRKQYRAVVQSLSATPPVGFEIKPIIAIVDDEPLVNIGQLMLWKWMANYYMCTIGEVMTAALPNGLRNEYKPRYETYVRLNPALDSDEKIGRALQSLTRAKKQETLLLDFLALSNNGEIPKRLLHAHSPAAFNACVEKKYWKRYSMK